MPGQHGEQGLKKKGGGKWGHSNIWRNVSVHFEYFTKRVKGNKRENSFGSPRILTIRNMREHKRIILPFIKLFPVFLTSLSWFLPGVLMMDSFLFYFEGITLCVLDSFFLPASVGVSRSFWCPALTCITTLSFTLYQVPIFPFGFSNIQKLVPFLSAWYYRVHLLLGHPNKINAIS